MKGKPFFMNTTICLSDLLTLAKLILPPQVMKSATEERFSSKIVLHAFLEKRGMTIIEKPIETPILTPFVLDFQQRFVSTADYKKVTFHYFTNPDGSMRWLFPSHLSSPTFLSFYNASNYKAKLMAFGLRMAFRMRLQKWVSNGSFDLHHTSTPYFLSLPKPKQAESYSVFMGTLGPNRKAILELNKGGKTTHFVKVALNSRSVALLKNESTQLDELENFGLTTLNAPCNFLIGNGQALTQPTLQTNYSKRSVRWTYHHTLAKLEMEEKSIQNSLSVSEFIESRFAKVLPLLDNEIPLVRTMALKVGQACFRANSLCKTIPTSFCHNDFTPWNMYVDKTTLQVYDWELAGYAPALTDVFHYHFQKGTMMEKQSYKAIREDIFQVLAHPTWHSFIKTHQLDISFQLFMYVIFVASNNLEIYSKQKELHWQAIALLKNWNIALEEMLAWQKNTSFRKQFIFSFFEALESVQYCYLKFIYGNLEDIPESSDIDLLISSKDLPAAITFIENSPLVKKAKHVRKSFMSTMHVFFQDGTFLSIDLITSLKRKEHFMMDAKEILANRQLKNHIYVAHPKHDMEYMLLFYQLNKSGIPVRHCEHLATLPMFKQSMLTSYLSEKYEIAYYDIAKFFPYDASLAKQLQSFIYYTNKNVGFNALFNKVTYWFDTVKSALNNKGFILTFSGVDGAGKSTVISAIKSLLESKYRKQVVVLRHRPSLLPILSAWVHGREKAEKMTTERLPRTGNNKSQWKSLFRFGYYLSDYLLGQMYVYLKYIVRGKVVLYDRYYFDFISDAKRSNLVLNPRIPKALYFLIHKPELNVFLYAPAFEILKRKQEIPAQEIEELTRSYQELFSYLSKKDGLNHYVSIKNMDLSETLDQIESQLIKIA